LAPAAYCLWQQFLRFDPQHDTAAQLLHGPSGLINSGGASGANDFEEAVATAVINKRAGGTGLISGCRAFQRPMKEGVQLLNAIQDVYLNPEVTIA
jgi:class I fructose-bisphosphate aldolase